MHMQRSSFKFFILIRLHFSTDLIIKSMESCKTHISENDKKYYDIHAREDNWLNLPSSVGRMEREKK